MENIVHDDRERSPSKAARITSFCLSLARRLPRTKVGLLGRLQDIDDRAREDFDRDVAGCQPPAGSRLTYNGFILFEIYPIELFDELRIALTRLFPGLHRPFAQDEFNPDFESAASIMAGRWWRRMGILCSPRNVGRFIPHDQITSVELPSDVEYIEVELRKTWPTAFVVIFNVHLENNGRDETATILERIEPRVELRRLFPLSRLGLSVQFWSLRQDLRDSTRRIRNRTQSAVERKLRRYFHGFFSRAYRHRVCRLPSIDVLTLDGAPAGGDEYAQWMVANLGWCDAKWLDVLDDCFISDKIAWIRHAPIVGRPPIHSIVVRSAALTSEDERFHQSRASAISGIVEEIVQHLSTWISTEAMLWHIEQTLAERFREVEVLLASRPRLRKYHKIQDLVIRDGLLLDRLALDLSWNKRAFNDLESPDMLFRRYQRRDRHLGAGPASLKNDLSAALERRHKYLKDCVDYLRRATTDVVAAATLQVNVRLQKQVLWLTFAAVGVAAVGTIIALATNWDSALKFWKAIT